MDLMKLARGYLEAEGYTVGQRGKDILVGSKPAPAGERQFFYVTVPNLLPGTSFRSQEPPLMSRLKEINDQHPTAQKVVLVPSREGLSAEFLRGAPQWYNATIRVPVEFFDTPFVWEETSGQARSEVQRLVGRGQTAQLERVVQPFSVIQGVDTTGPADVLDTLAERLAEPLDSKRSVHVVVGPAGMGKSYLFDALYSRLHEAFMSEKRRRNLAARPFALLPEYLPGAEGPSVKSLLRAYLQQDMVRTIDPRVFEWMLGHGFAVWMLDGLDEVIDRDPEFFNYLEDLLTMPGMDVSPRIVICVRDSLLATNPAFHEFSEECQEYLNIYRLEPWLEESRSEYARRRLRERSGNFLQVLRGAPVLQGLAGTPYYCQLLVTQFELDQLRPDYSEAELLQLAMEDIVRREFRKRVLDEKVITEGVVTDFAEALALVDFENGFRGVPIDDANYWAQLSLPATLNPEDREKYQDQLTKMALFSYGGLGHIRFAQEVLELYLVGQWLSRVFDRSPEMIVAKLATMQLPQDWIATRIMAHNIRIRNRVGVVKDLLYQAQHRPVAFKNLLQLLVMASDSPDVLRGIGLERQDLSGLVFHGIDFADMSLRGSDLSRTRFESCSLRGAILADATLRGTTFDLQKADDLSGADFGSLASFYSIVVDHKRVLSDHKAAAKWLAERTKVVVPPTGPCAAALQVRLIFGKYIYPNGFARRDWHGRKALMSGTRHLDPGRVLESMVRYGYLVPDQRLPDRFRRADGDLYTEMRAFVMNMQLGPTVLALLGDTCTVPDCRHIPQL